MVNLAEEISSNNKNLYLRLTHHHTEYLCCICVTEYKIWYRDDSPAL